MPAIIDSVLRAGEGKTLRKLKRIADQVNSIEEDMAALSDAELRGLTDEFRQRYADGESLDDLMPEAFAAVREAARRTIGQRHFDVQIMGGAALHMGNIAEMKTGEGKTLTGALPAYLNALTGQGVHIVTVNDYLARYQSEWMGRIHRFLGMEMGVILSEMDPEERRKQYAADITYGTNNEFGFDYLRDNMAWGLEECVQRGHNFAIVDEVDSILIDEARTPLIISGPVDQNSIWYQEFARIAPRLRRGEDGEGDYEVDEKKRTVGVQEAGVEKVEDWLGIDNLYESVNTPLISFLNNAIKAKELYTKDKDYVVMNGEILIVDEFTGRILPGRRWSEGMHQAVEAKEGVPIKDENQTLATITLQNYFRLYDKLAGMTGTAMTEANEFHQTYKLGVVPIPTNKPMIRADESDVVYQTTQAKFEALVEDIAGRHETGQPVLVGTTSVEKSELVSKLLKRRGIAHEVLNAKYHEREAAIIAQAGRKGAVTVATNMAGRGTDIMLGGNPEFIADLELHQRGLSPVDTPEDFEAAWPEAVEKARKAVAEEHEEVVAAGGLYVLGTERHESRRIDNQLRGRSGRQGDPGESRFYLSLEDDLMRRFNADKIAHIMELLKQRGITHKVLNAKFHEQEAAIVAQAGHKGAVTVATNMAGRGTDIMLGGNPEFLADAELHQRGLSPVDTPEDFEAAWPEAVEKARKSVAEEHEEVVATGGLYVLGTERHESRRIDNQLRGRSGRQGDPGESRFYLSLEDDLMRRFNADKIAHIMELLKTPPEVPLESKTVSRAIRSAQTQVEQQNFEIRKDLLKYDDVMNRQRHVVYEERHRVLEGADLQEQIDSMIDEVVASYVAGATAEGFPEEWDLDRLWRAFRQLYPVGLTTDQLIEEAGGDRSGLSGEFITDAIKQDALAAYERRTEELGPELMREFERRVVLSVLDRKWREHLYEMDYLREGIGLRGWAQRDPLVEYQREGYDMFNTMMDGIKEESVGSLFNLQVQVQQDPIVADGDDGEAAGTAALSAPGFGAAPAQPQSAPSESVRRQQARGGSGFGPAQGGRPAADAPGQAAASPPAAGRAARRQAGAGQAGAGQAGPDQAGAGQPAAAALAAPGLARPKRSGQLNYTAPSTDATGAAEQRTTAADGADYSKVGRNAPCPCGSGRKFKQCHGDPRNR
ncbi:MAG TPA: preprotein translocase subunit SecA [Streptosporangiaceae bacterium]